MQQQIAAVGDRFARQCAVYLGIPPPPVRQTFGITTGQLRLIGPINPGNIDIVAKHHGCFPQWCMNTASKRMIGSGIPISQSNTPFPKVMATSI
jgi:hypothetical protein